jgi:response regulator of citrate/malate metabolism
MEWFEEFIKELSNSNSLIDSFGKPIEKKKLERILEKYQNVKHNNSKDLTEIQREINKHTENIENILNDIETLNENKK